MSRQGLGWQQQPSYQLSVLLRLRFRALLRKGSGGRTGKSSRLGLPVWLRYLAIVLVGIFFSYWGAMRLTDVVGGAVGRLVLGGVLTWASTTAMILLFLLALPLVLAVFTYNSDLRLLLLTPLSPRLLMAEKFVSLYLQITPLMLLLGIPALLGVGQTLQLGLGYSVGTVLALLVLPIAPLSLAMLVLLIVLRLLPPRVARTATAVFGTMLGLVVYIGIQVLNSRSTTQRTIDMQHLFAQVPRAWWSTLPTTWAGQGLLAAAEGQTGSALAYLGATVVLSLGLAGLAIWLYARLFASGWATYQEVGRGRSTAFAPASAGHLTQAALPAAIVGVAPPGARAVGLRQVWRPWWRKEWLSLRRDPQLWTRLLYVAVVLVFGLYRALGQQTGPGAGRLAGADKTTFIVTLTLAAYFLTVFLAPRLVNREGKSLYLLALAPPSPGAILLVKGAFCALPTMIIVDVILVGGGTALHLAPWHIALSALAFPSLIAAETGAQLVLGLIWPRLDWDNPRRQVSTQASVFGVIGGLILAGGFCVLLLFTLTQSGPLPAPLSGILIFVLTWLMLTVSVVIAPRRFAALLAGER